MFTRFYVIRPIDAALIVFQKSTSTAAHLSPSCIVYRQKRWLTAECTKLRNMCEWVPLRNQNVCNFFSEIRSCLIICESFKSLSLNWGTSSSIPLLNCIEKCQNDWSTWFTWMLLLVFMRNEHGLLSNVSNCRWNSFGRQKLGSDFICVSFSDLGEVEVVSRKTNFMG